MRCISALLLVSLAVLITSSAEAKTVEAPKAAAQKGAPKEANAELPKKGGKKGGKKAKAAEEATTQDSGDYTTMVDTTPYEGIDEEGGPPGCHEHEECQEGEYCSYVISHFGFECEKKAEAGTRCWRNEKCKSGKCEYDLSILWYACTEPEA
jgi:hypothetical protein